MPMLRRLIFDDPRSPASRTVKIVTGAVLLLGFSLLCWTVLASSVNSIEILSRYRTVFWNGWLLTIALSAAALILSIVIGLLAALGRRSSVLLLRYFSIGYIECIRGTPFLVLILFLFYGVPQITQFGNRMVFGVLALSLFSGAYLAEIFRAGIESVSVSQRESARAIGLTPVQAFRYVVFPQAVRFTLPALAGQFASLIKDSSLLSIVGLAEFTFSARQVFSATYSTMESFLPLAVGYLLLTVPVSLLTRRLEHTLRFET